MHAASKCLDFFSTQIGVIRLIGSRCKNAFDLMEIEAISISYNMNISFVNRDCLATFLSQIQFLITNGRSTADAVSI